MVTMKTFNSREEWLKGRSSQIGGSDAASIMGLSPWKSNVELWEEKTHRRDSPDISNKPEVVFGTLAESEIRNLFSLDYPQYEVHYEENNMWTNDLYPWAHASLDGWLIEKGTDRKGILEIKTSLMNGASGAKWHDRIPDAYFCQILHYFMVTEFDFAILKARLKYDYEGSEPFCQIRHYRIEREEVANDIVTLIEWEKDFMRSIEHDERPARLLPDI